MQRTPDMRTRQQRLFLVSKQVLDHPSVPLIRTERNCQESRCGTQTVLTGFGLCEDGAPVRDHMSLVQKVPQQAGLSRPARLLPTS